MKKSMLKFGMTWVVFLCVLFLFEMATGQEGVVDLSIADCSVEKIPGTDSVLIKARLQYWVASFEADSVDFRVSVKIDDVLFASGYVAYSTASGVECTYLHTQCEDGYCPVIWMYSCDPYVCKPCGEGTPKLLVGFCQQSAPLQCACYYYEWEDILVMELKLASGTKVTIVVDDLDAVSEYDEDNNECSTIYTPTDIPTLTEWGLIIFGVVLLGFITWVFLRRRKAVASYQ